MNFYLVYNGPLSASASSSKRSEIAFIREQLSGQLAELWKTHPSLQRLIKEGADGGQGHQGWGAPAASSPTEPLYAREVMHQFEGYMDLIGHIEVGDTCFQPLIRESLKLNCELEILFLRQGDPGALISQGGDLDNRIKTLLDALRIPSPEEFKKEKKEPLIATPQTCIYCLMESDTLVSTLNVDTNRLLFPSSHKPNEVHLVIKVSVRLLEVNKINYCLI